MPIRWRLTVFHALTVLVIVTVLVAITIVAMIRGAIASVEQTAQARAIEVTRLLESGARLDSPTLARLAQGNVWVVVRDGAGTVLTQTVNPIAEADTDGSDRFWEFGARLVSSRPKAISDEADEPWRRALSSGQAIGGLVGQVCVFSRPVAAVDSPARVVEAWKSYDAAGEALLPFGPGVVYVVPVAVMLAIGGSYLVTRSSLAPVDALVASAREISERDLSERLPVQGQRDELGRLATTINQLLMRLEMAFNQREALLTHQRRFVADASHERRTPLTSILGYARMLRHWGLSDPVAARESVAAIEREAVRMDTLVENLPSLARGDEAPTLVLGRHDLRVIAKDAVDAARAVADHNVTIAFDLPTDPAYANVDPDRIRQATTILLDNAVKYSPHGGRVTVSLHAADGHAELAVTDSGIGIGAEHLPHIFERFYRVDPARGAGGTGLGLAIARQIAEIHGGAINVTSETGRGSRFTLCLPKIDS